MKKNNLFLFIIVVMLLTACDFIKNDEIKTASDGHPGFTISVTKTAVLYRGLENQIDVCVASYDRDSIILSIDGEGSIIKEDYIYIVHLPESAPDIVNISVSVNTAEGEELLGTRGYRVLNVPVPEVSLGGVYKSGISVPKAVFIYNPYLEAKLTANFFPFEEVDYKVVKFDFLYNIDELPKVISVEGERFTEEVLSVIENMEEEDTLSFVNVFVTTPSGEKQTKGLSYIIQ